MSSERKMKFWPWVKMVTSNKWQAVVNRLLVPALLSLTQAGKGSWRERQIRVLGHCLWKIPDNWLKASVVSNKHVENIYDRVSGGYIKHQELKGYMHWAVVDNQPAWVSSVEVSRRFRDELCQAMGGGAFDSILEVGAGELNTLAHVARHFGPEKHYLGIELSLNRLCHGYDYFCHTKGLQATLAKADACFLPLPDKSVDVIYTAHCLELMPPQVFRKAIAEMCRVARKRVCLFQPSWELSGTLPRLKMVAEQYVRGIVAFVETQPGARLVEHRLTATTPNPFNRTALHVIEVESGSEAPAAPQLVCPSCRSALEQRQCHLFCGACQSLYFRYENIPVLDPAYAHNVTCLLHKRASGGDA
jgi:ubiquinone/menaquinone biosynthesis C-methylase UbiE